MRGWQASCGLATFEVVWGSGTRPEPWGGLLDRLEPDAG